MAVVDTSRFHKGLKIILDGEIWEIVEYKHSKVAQQSPVVTTKLKNIVTGSVQEKKFRSGDTFNLPDIQRREMQYIYKDDFGYHFMDNETFEQYAFRAEDLGNTVEFLKDNQDVVVQIYEKKPIGVELPTAVEFEVISTEPGLKGDTVSSTTKPAVIETGTTVNVPLFVNTGDRIKVDTRDGSYIERVKK